MDGILTAEDMRNRYTIVLQCRECKKWTEHKNWLPSGHNEYLPCTECEAKSYDRSSIKSLRTYNPLTDNKRKIK